MPIRRLVRCLAALAFLLLSVRTLSAQQVLVGNTFPLFGSNANPTAVTTYVQTQVPAVSAGTATSAVFGWSVSPCPAAVKVKFFHVQHATGAPGDLATMYAERGPFDVTAALTPSGFVPPVIQTVVLDPPVELKAGDVIGLTNLTTCGGPTYSGVPPGLGVPSPAPSSVKTPGDVPGVLISGIFDPPVLVFATGTGSSGGGALDLLGRFEVRLAATDPRTGRQTTGTPVPLAPSVGYFSLPDFTGDPSFPELIIKMVDATGTASLGGDFWFFWAPLTDVDYTITVLDTRTGATRVYKSGSPGPGVICGGVDTSAFPP